MKAPCPTPPKKFKRVSSAGKVIDTTFWDSQGIIMVDYLEEGRTINDAYYAEELAAVSGIVLSWKGMLNWENGQTLSSHKVLL